MEKLTGVEKQNAHRAIGGGILLALKDGTFIPVFIRCRLSQREREYAEQWCEMLGEQLLGGGRPWRE